MQISSLMSQIGELVYLNTACTGPFDKIPGMEVTTLGQKRSFGVSSETDCAKKCREYNPFNCQAYVIDNYKRCTIYDFPTISFIN